MPGTTMRMPALAVVGSDHRIVRSTEAFRQRYAGAQALCEDSPELDQVLTGRSDNAVVNLGELSVAIEAVTDAAGRRQAMLSLPTEWRAAAPETPVNALRDAAERSPAIVWVKDLDGRYLYANPRFVADFDTAEDTLLGKTDAEIPPEETVDGPRLAYAQDGLEEPLQLEYTVPMFDGRPALTALRFALRDRSGQPIGTCGVAAPISEAAVAREEAVRLMQLERWNRLDPLDVRAEVLEQWHVQAAPVRFEDDDVEESLDSAGEAGVETEAIPEPAEREDEDARAARDEPRRAKREPQPAPEPAEPKPAPVVAAPIAPALEPGLTEAVAGPQNGASASEAARLQSDLQLARKWADRADQLQADLQQAQAGIHEAEAETQHALGAAARATEEADRLRANLADARRELERVQAEAHAARAELEAARGELGATRAQAEALRAPSAAAVRLSEELGRALAAERERGDELARVLARVGARLNDFESALEVGLNG
jgi:PAS domain-containing protein